MVLKGPSLASRQSVQISVLILSMLSLRAYYMVSMVKTFLFIVTLGSMPGHEVPLKGVNIFPMLIF